MVGPRWLIRRAIVGFPSNVDINRVIPTVCSRRDCMCVNKFVNNSLTEIQYEQLLKEYTKCYNDNTNTKPPAIIKWTSLRIKTWKK